MNENTREIDLLKVAAYIFYRKKILLISVILSLCLGLIYINSITKEKVIYLNLDILNNNDLYDYSLINFLSSEFNNPDTIQLGPLGLDFNAPNVNFNAPNVTNEESLGLNFIVINSDNLGILAMTIFNDRLIKNEIIKSNNFLNTSIDDDVKLGKILTNFVLLEPILNNDAVNLSGRQLTPYYQLRFKTTLDSDDQNYKNLFLHVLNEIENRVKEKINTMYQRNINLLSIKNRFELDKLINKKNNLIDDYLIERKARLLYLEENLAIAKAIEQDPQSIERAPFLDNSKITANDPLPYYFYGSTAIMQEIQEVKKDMNVTNPSVAIKGVLSIDSDIRKINQNKTAEEINIALAASPLGENNEFRVFSYDIDNLKFTTEGNSNYLILFFFGLIGVFFGFVSIFIAYLRNEIKNLS